jgi:transposase-like protein
MKAEKRLYDRVFKNKALSLLYESGSLVDTADQLDVSTVLLKNWQKEYEKYGAGSFPGRGKILLTPEDQIIKDLEKKLRILNLHFEILKNAEKYLYKDKSTVFDFISVNKTVYSIRMMCRVLCINRKSYYNWEKHFLSPTQKRKFLVQKEITVIFHTAEQRYGSERIRAVLQKSGYCISSTTVKKYMKELGLVSKLKNRKKQ